LEQLISPYGGRLKNLIPSQDRIIALKKELVSCDSIDLNLRQICDLELMLSGAYSPLNGYLNREDYESVLDHLRLKNVQVWTIPIVLDIPEARATRLEKGVRLSLRDQEGCILAALTVEDIWEIDKKREAQQLFGTTDEAHPGVRLLHHETMTHSVSGKIEGLQLPAHYDYKIFRLTPLEVRTRFSHLGWRRILAFQTEAPLHCADQEVTLQALKKLDANLLLHPAIGLTKPGDKDYHTRVRCYIEVAKKYPPNRMMFSLLPHATKHGGPRETLLHGIVRRNYGCQFLMINPAQQQDAGINTNEGTFTDRFPDSFKIYEQEIGVVRLPFEQMVYVEDKAQYRFEKEVPASAKIRQFSKEELHRRLSEGLDIPEWFSYPEVVQALRRSYLPKDKQGITIFFTGLSGAGKSTIANVLLVRLLEMGGRPVTLLDGDIVRKHLSSELGFSKEHRDINVRRIGFVASEITKNGGIAICAPIAPYKNTRAFNRALISQNGKYVEVHVSTPLEVCEGRDRKGLYAKAKAGLIKGFTGINDPYEIPESPELVIDSSNLTPEEATQEILLYLENNGYIK